MYRRYEPSPRRKQEGGNSLPQTQGGTANKRVYNEHRPMKSGTLSAHTTGKKPPQKNTPKNTSAEKKAHPLTKLIPQSIYNFETGKVFGLLSPDDLLIIALILLLIDSGDEEEDNSLLLYALLYILIAEHIDLPFL